MARILVVDDSALIRMKCSKLLIDNGYDVVEAKNGAEAIEKYKEFNPDGVLLDIIMPEMHGIAALREIKKIDPVARVAMLSAMGQRNMVMGALKEGAKDFVVKPFREGRVLDTVKRLLGNANLDPFLTDPLKIDYIPSFRLPTLIYRRFSGRAMNVPTLFFTRNSYHSLCRNKLYYCLGLIRALQ